MKYIIKAFVGRYKEKLGDATYYSTNLPAKEIREAHKRGCKEVGIKRWDDYFTDQYDLSEDQAMALFQIPGIEESFEKNEYAYNKKYPWSFIGDSWSEVYLEVARFGAVHMGKTLEYKVIPSEEIDMGGHIWGYIQ